MSENNGSFTFKLVQDRRSPHFHLLAVNERFEKVKKKGALYSVEKTQRETQLLFGCGRTFYRLKIPGDLIYMGLRCPRVIPYLPRYMRRTRAYRTIFKCNATVEQLRAAETHAEELFNLLKVLVNLRYLPKKKKNQAIESFLKLGPDKVKPLDLMKENERCGQLHRKSVEREQLERREFTKLLVKTRKEGATKLPDGSYIVYLHSKWYISEAFPTLGHEAKGGFELYHVSKRGKVRKFSLYGMPFRKTVLRLIKRAGYPNGTKKVEDQEVLRGVAQALGKVNSAIVLLILPGK